MSAHPAYEVHHSESALESLQEIDPSLQSLVNKVLLELGTNLERYPERSYRNHNKQWVYCHPNPKVEITYSLDKKRGIVNCLHVVAPLARLVAFVSYCHKDKKFLEEEFRPYMLTLEEQGLIEFWHDGKIDSGTEWETDLQQALHSAGAAVLIVTQGFLFSDYIRHKELPVLEDGFKAGKVRVHWLHVESATYQDFWFGRLQALCDPAVPLKALKRATRLKRLTEICQELKRQIVSR